MYDMFDLLKTQCSVGDHKDINNIIIGAIFVLCW